MSMSFARLQPRLQDQQPPELNVPVADAGVVLVEHRLHRFGADEVSHTSVRASEEVVRERAQLAAQPARQRHAEAYLRAREDLARHDVFEGALEDVLEP